MSVMCAVEVLVKQRPSQKEVTRWKGEKANKHMALFL